MSKFAGLFAIIESRFLLLKLKTHKVTCSSKIMGNHCSVKNKGKILLGDNVNIISNPSGQLTKTVLYTFKFDSLLQIGNNSILRGASFYTYTKIVVGDNCIFGPETYISDIDWHDTSTDVNTRRTRNGENGAHYNR